MEAEPVRIESRLDRLGGLILGCSTHGLFLLTVWRLFHFLHMGTPAVDQPNLWFDALLAVFFAVPHSVLLLPAVRARLERSIRPEFYGLFYCDVTCCSLLLLFANWQGSHSVVWELSGAGRTIVLGCFYASWIALFYSLSLTGLGYQTGWTPWWHWVRRRPLPRRTFAPRGAYHLLRHPVYLSFLGLIWFTPRMTLDHAVLTGLWTTYIFVGSYLKDERLAFYVGQPYRKYQQQVSGYPLMPFGPLSRRAAPPAGVPKANRGESPSHRSAA